MLKLNKNSRNMVGALAVAAIFFIIVKCMKSEGYFRKNKGKCRRENGVKVCSYGDGKWFSARNAGIGGAGHIGVDKNVKGANVCRENCMKNRDCVGFVHNVHKKMCVYKSKDQIPRSPKGIKKKRGSHLYVKSSRFNRD